MDLDNTVFKQKFQETFGRFRKDVDYISSHGACFGAKLVRGAYMEKERQMAREQGYPDPVHETFDNTSAMYHKSMTFLMDKVRINPDRYLMIVASHNDQTVQLAIRA